MLVDGWPVRVESGCEVACVTFVAGKTMTTAEMVAYAYDQIDQARTELNAGVDDIRGSQNFVSEIARRYDGHR